MPGIKKILYIDLETYCKLNLNDCGVHRYAADPSFAILLMSYAVDEGPVRTLDLSGMNREEACKKISEKINRSNTIKCAHNANFEMTCLRAYGLDINPHDWIDTMAMAEYAALPPSLAALSSVLGLEDKGKLNSGKELIQMFSRPDKNGKRKTKDFSQATNLTLGKDSLSEEPSDWDRFIEYNRRDVEAERAIYHRLKKSYELPKREREIFALDYDINLRGIHVDMELVNSAADLAKTISDNGNETLHNLTGGINPASVPQFKKYLTDNLKDKIDPGLLPKKITKTDLENLLELSELPDNVRKAIKLKLLINKAAVKKYDTIRRTVCPEDNTVKGMFQYYGTRTGRWAGRLVQLQNLRRNSLPDLDWARNKVKEKKGDRLQSFYQNLDVSEILGQLVRTAFVPSHGNKLIIADFSAIEARIIAWLAGETWRQNVFKDNGDIYKSSYSKAFNVPIEQITKEMRQKGKIMELALGFGGSVGAMKRFGADKLGLDDNELKNLVTRWRRTSPKITQLWANLQNAATGALTEGLQTPLPHKISIKRCEQKIIEKTKGATNWALSVQLPSGRCLFYQNACCEEVDGKQEITYFDVEQTSRNWLEARTYGGKLTENVVQAVARDCLADAMLRLSKAGYKIVSHIHDEVIIDAPANTDPADIEVIMTQQPAWADAGLYLNVKSHKEDFYCKD